MKKVILLIAAVLQILPSMAQNNLTLTEDQPVLIYSLPETAFYFDVELEKTTQIPGQFYQYSQRYLATTDVITEEKVSYRVKNVSLRTNTIADSSRTFQIDAKTAINFPVVNRKGIICGVNIPLPQTKLIEKKILRNEKPKTASPALLQLGEEFMMAGSTAKLAEGAAKQIYRIRESRMMLLGGDMDQHPSDGKALNTMLEGLDRTEAELTWLFTGKTLVEKQLHTIRLVPDSSLTNKVLFRVSTQRGLVDAADLGGAPVYVSILPLKIKTQAPDPKSKPEKVGIYTVLPAITTVKVSDGTKTYLETQLPLPQFGVLIPLPEKILNARHVKIHIDSDSGRLLSVEK